MSLISFKPYLDSLYKTFDLSFLSPDPLEFVHKFDDHLDIEVVGLLASSLAYGRVERILISIDQILSIMDYKPSIFVKSFNFPKDNKKFNGFKHRFNTGYDISCLIMAMQRCIADYGSLKLLFLSGYNKDDKNIKQSLVGFVTRLLDASLSFADVNKRTGIKYLLPSPASGSACKRINLFLRWMVRRGDKLDIGIWKEISPSKLILPLDTHTSRICRYIGLTDRKNPDWKMAEEITNNLKLIAPEDPVKYDFAICRLGILKECPTKVNKVNCKNCQLFHICKKKGLL